MEFFVALFCGAANTGQSHLFLLKYMVIEDASRNAESLAQHVDTVLAIQFGKFL